MALLRSPTPPPRVWPARCGSVLAADAVTRLAHPASRVEPESGACGQQCLNAGSTCTASWPQPVDLVAELPLRNNQWLAVGALVPLIVLSVLWLTSYRSWQRYERRADIALAPDALTDARFWRGRAWVQRLRAVHVMVGMAVTDMVLVYPVAADDRRAGRPIWTVGTTLFILLVLAVIAAVADIVLRVTTLTAQGTPVLLAGHSHGSVLVATAARYLPKASLRRTALLSSACPLTRLIEPFFAAFFDRDASLDLAAALTDERCTRWINLYRITDPIGGPVFAPIPNDPDRADPTPGPVDQLAPDPPEADLAGIEPEVRGHDSYLHDPAFTAAHDRLVECLATAAGP